MANQPAIIIDAATLADLPAINDIYNFYVQASTATYQDDPETPEARRAWFDKHGPAHPVIVAREGERGRVVGWGSLSPFHARSAYRQTVECSVYIEASHHRRGIGRAILHDLIARARASKHHTIIAGIDAEQAPSLALHESLGFQHVAHLRQVGFKFDRWLDVIYLQLML